MGGVSFNCFRFFPADLPNVHSSVNESLQYKALLRMMSIHPLNPSL